MSTASADILDRATEHAAGHAIVVRPLQPTIGAEIEGVDPSRPISFA